MAGAGPRAMSRLAPVADAKRALGTGQMNGASDGKPSDARPATA